MFRWLKRKAWFKLGAFLQLLVGVVTSSAAFITIYKAWVESATGYGYALIALTGTCTIIFISTLKNRKLTRYIVLNFATSFHNWSHLLRDTIFEFRGQRNKVFNEDVFLTQLAVVAQRTATILSDVLSDVSNTKVNICIKYFEREASTNVTNAKIKNMSVRVLVETWLVCRNEWRKCIKLATTQSLR